MVLKISYYNSIGYILTVNGRVVYKFGLYYGDSKRKILKQYGLIIKLLQNHISLTMSRFGRFGRFGRFVNYENRLNCRSGKDIKKAVLQGI